jgi:peptidoglycan/LPS O-acetylase OafA/YrhL
MGTIIIPLLLPAFLMGMLLWALPKDTLVIRAPSRKLMIVAAMGAAILILIFFALPDYCCTQHYMRRRRLTGGNYLSAQ